MPYRPKGGRPRKEEAAIQVERQARAFVEEEPVGQKPVPVPKEEYEQIVREREQYAARGVRRPKGKVRGIRATAVARQRHVAKRFFHEECPPKVVPECRYCIAGRPAKIEFSKGVWVKAADLPEDWEELGIVPTNVEIVGWSVINPDRKEAIIRHGRGTGQVARFRGKDEAWKYAVEQSEACLALKRPRKMLVSPEYPEPAKRKSRPVYPTEKLPKAKKGDVLPLVIFPKKPKARIPGGRRKYEREVRKYQQERERERLASRSTGPASSPGASLDGFTFGGPHKLFTWGER